MIFITLGTQKFNLNRLLTEIDDLIEKNVIKEPVFAQIGTSNYKPVHYQFEKFLDPSLMKYYYDNADLIIAHGGSSSIIESLRRGKKLIIVPRLAQFKEHVDDHQIEIANVFKNKELAEICTDIKALGSIICEIRTLNLKPYKHESGRLAHDIMMYIDRRIT